MKQIEKDLNKIKQIKLRDDEKDLIRANLVDKITKRPTLSPYKINLSPYVLVSNWNKFSLVKVGAFAVMFMFIFGSSLTYASEKSLPGEALYFIKVNIKEEVEIKLASTSEKKANIEKNHIEKRLQEISTLKESGDLNEKNSEIVIEKFKEKTESLNESIDTLQEEGNSKAVLQITQSLIPVLTNFVEESTEEEVSTKPEIEYDLTPKEIEEKTEEENKELVENPSLDVTDNISSFISVTTEEIEKIVAQETEVIEEVKEETEVITEDLVETSENDTNLEIKTGISSNDLIKIPEISTITPTTSSMEIIDEIELGDFGILQGKVLGDCTSANEDCSGKEIGAGTIIIYTQNKESLLKTITVDSTGQFKTKLSPGSYVVDIRRIGTEKIIGVPEVINVSKNENTFIEINVYEKGAILDFLPKL